MKETFRLSNVVPQDIDNNGGYWNMLEVYCRELVDKYEELFIISGPLWIPETKDGKSYVHYQVKTTALDPSFLKFGNRFSRSLGKTKLLFRPICIC